VSHTGAHAPSRTDAKAWARETLRGFYNCPLTPFNEQFELDEVALRENTSAFVELGVDGLVVGGFFAEGWNMTLDEWRDYHRVMAEEVAGRVPLLTIILESSAYQAAEKLRFVESLGYAGAEVMNPSVQLKRDDEIVDFFGFLAGSTQLPLILYRTPVSGTVYGHETVQRLAQIDTVVGVKNGTLSWNDSLALRRLLGDQLVVSEPNERLFAYDVGLFGGQVLFGEQTFLLYGRRREELRRYTELALEGHFEEAKAISDGLDPVRDIVDDVLIGTIARTASYVAAMPYLKAWLELLGFAGGLMRPPARAAISAQEREQLAQRLTSAGVL